MPRPALSLPFTDVWRGQELAHAQERVVPSGHEGLDAQLPGGGWPLGHLVELLQERPQQHAWQLLLPALVQATRQEAGPVVLVGAPLQPFCPGLQAQGLAAQRLLLVNADQSAARLWATEQALRCAEVAAVVAWLPRCASADLRRLHVAAQQHGRLLFVFRSSQAQAQASPARVRLLLQGAQQLQVRILKRRGPPLLQPIELAAQPARLAALLEARKGKPASVPALPPVLPLPGSRSHVLDRTAAPA